MLDELTESIKAKLYDFTVSPLLITFITSWIGWNYRFVLVVLSSEMAPEEKFNFIQSQLFRCWLDYVGQGFLGPLATTLVFLFVYPYPAKYVFSFWRKRQQELRELKNKIDGETLLTRDESSALKKVNAELEAKLAETNDNLATTQSLALDKSKTIDTLKQEISVLKAGNGDSKVSTVIKPGNPSNPENGGFNELERKIVGYIAAAEETNTLLIVDTLHGLFSREGVVDRVSTRAAIERLAARKLIRVGGDPESIQFLPAGREEYLRNRDARAPADDGDHPNPSPK